MKQLRFEEKDKLSDILKSIQDTQDEDIEIVSVGNNVLELPLNKKVVNHTAEKLGKKISFRDKSHRPSVVPTITPKQESHGFIEGKDVADQSQDLPTENKTETNAGEQVITPAKKVGLVARFKKILKGPKWVYALLGTILFIIIAGVLSIWLIPSADVTLFTKSAFQEAEFTLTASENVEEADKEQGIIPLRVLETSQEDSIEVSATGSKTVGTLAKGRVKIVNRDSNNSKTFFKGAVVSTVLGAKLSFTLDNQATLSAAPVGCIADCPSVGVDITAKAIGDGGNLKSGTVFKIGDADVNLVFAKNDTNFSGGSSKKVTIVSADDHKKAKEDLIKKLEEEAKEDLEKENPQIIIPEGGLENDIVSESFSQKVGDESSNFGLSMEVKFSAKTFSKNDLKDILIGKISDNIPNGFVLDEEGVLVSSEILQEDDSQISILGKIKAALLPEVNELEVKRNIAGKDFGSAESYLKSLNGVSGFEVVVRPVPFRIFGILPMLQSKINISVKQEE